MADELKLSLRGERVWVDVQVTPRASRSQVLGVHDGRLRVSLDAPPVDGAANAALIAAFAKWLKVKKRDVEIVRGDTSRLKTLAIAGTTEASVRALCER